MKTMKYFALLTVAAVAAQAHFVWVVPSEGQDTGRLILSETLEDDPAVGVEMIQETELSLRNLAGEETGLEFTQEDNHFRTALPGSGNRVVHGFIDLGLMQSSGVFYVLQYHPKTILGDPLDAHSLLNSEVPVELIPLGEPGAMKLRLVAQGKPLPEAEVTLIQPDGSEEIVVTDAWGDTPVLEQTGQMGAWARYWEEDSAGVRDDTEYSEVRHYATLVFDSLAAGEGQSRNGASASLRAMLPEQSASLGTTVSDGYLYIYGGHVAPTHVYSEEAVSGKFFRMRFRDQSWEELPGGPNVQGMNLAAHEGKIYRIGGMTPQNSTDATANNLSIDHSARFNPQTREWEGLPALPEPRSSHDVVVIGDDLIVTAGWRLDGREEVWAEDTYIMDLSADELRWVTVAQPFQRRALMATAYDGKMWVVGGITPENEIVSDVTVFDPATRQWSDGPALPEGSWVAFSPAAGVHDGRLYVSVSDGTLLRLNDAAGEWEVVGKGIPRVAHRLVSDGERVLVVGGANDGDNIAVVEAFAVN